MLVITPLMGLGLVRQGPVELRTMRLARQPYELRGVRPPAIWCLVLRPYPAAVVDTASTAKQLSILGHPG